MSCAQCGQTTISGYYRCYHDQHFHSSYTSYGMGNMVCTKCLIRYSVSKGKWIPIKPTHQLSRGFHHELTITPGTGSESTWFEFRVVPTPLACLDTVKAQGPVKRKYYGPPKKTDRLACLGTVKRSRK